MMFVVNACGELILLKTISQGACALLLLCSFLITIIIVSMSCVLCLLCYFLLKVNFPKHLQSGRFTYFPNQACENNGYSHSMDPFYRRGIHYSHQLNGLSTNLFTGAISHELGSKKNPCEVLQNQPSSPSGRLD